jgi:hypothetical protein
MPENTITLCDLCHKHIEKESYPPLQQMVMFLRGDTIERGVPVWESDFEGEKAATPETVIEMIQKAISICGNDASLWLEVKPTG